MMCCLHAHLQPKTRAVWSKGEGVGVLGVVRTWLCRSLLDTGGNVSLTQPELWKVSRAML